MEFQKVEKRAGITKEIFQKEYLSTYKPVVFTDLVKDWSATEKWTFEWLKSNYGYLEVPLIGPNFHKPGPNYMKSKITKKFGDYLDLIKQDKPCDLRLFLWNIFNHAPELMNDFGYPDIMNGWIKKHPFMFFGGQGAKVNLHYDIDCSNVFLTQFQTRKRVVLFAPEQSPLLYQHPFTVQSHADIDNPDYEKWPALKKLKGYEVIVEHGETLFIPSLYWHYIEYMDGGYSISLRTNDKISTKVRGAWNLARHKLIDQSMNKVLGERWKNWKEETAIRKAQEAMINA